MVDFKLRKKWKTVRIQFFEHQKKFFNNRSDEKVENFNQIRLSEALESGMVIMKALELSGFF